MPELEPLQVTGKPTNQPKLPQPAAKPDDRLELDLRLVYPDEATPTLGNLRKDPACLGSLAHLLASFGERLPER